MPRQQPIDAGSSLATAHGVWCPETRRYPPRARLICGTGRGTVQQGVRHQQAVRVDRADLLREARVNPAGLRFSQACALAEAFGWTLARSASGSHRIYKRPGTMTLVVLPRRNRRESESVPGAANHSADR
jgi:predicted RNA binding protein YcfA (HicA-like mRNA interferase family)